VQRKDVSMNRPVASVKCMSVLAQVTMGYYDEDGNLVHEELFPQMEGNVLTAKLFHPQVEQLEKLMETCVEQAWAKLGSQARPPEAGLPGPEGTVNRRMLAARTTDGGTGNETG
jgi:hypothetical protein